MSPWHTLVWLLGYHLWFFHHCSNSSLLHSPHLLYLCWSMPRFSSKSPSPLYQTLTLHPIHNHGYNTLFFITIKFIFALQISLPNSKSPLGCLTDILNSTKPNSTHFSSQTCTCLICILVYSNFILPRVGITHLQGILVLFHTTYAIYQQILPILFY